MLANPANNSKNIILKEHVDISDGVYLNYSNAVLSSDFNANLISINPKENLYAQLNSDNSGNLRDTDGLAVENNSTNAKSIVNSTANTIKTSESSETIGISSGKSSETTSTSSESKIVLGESFSWGGYFQAVGVLFLLLGILCLVLWLMRKYGKFNFMPNPSELPKNALRLEAQLPLGPRKGLSVVRYLDKRLLLGITDQQITLLAESTISSDPDDRDDRNDRENTTNTDNKAHANDANNTDNADTPNFKEIFVAEQKQNENK